MNLNNVLMDWFFNSDKKIPIEILQNKSLFSLQFLLHMFLFNYRSCALVNKYYNNYYFASLEFEHQLYILKFLLNHYRFSRYNINYARLKYQEKNTEIAKIRKKYPYLKRKDIELILDKSNVLTGSIVKNNTKNKNKKNKILKFKDLVKENQSIKNSCQECPLINNLFCLFDSNSKANLNNIDIMFILDYPREKDIKSNKPMADNSFKILRKYIKNYIKANKLRYFVMNSIICQPNKNTDYKVIQKNCFNHIVKIIEKINPKLIVLVGSLTFNDFFENKKITENHGKIIKYKNRDAISIYHPLALNNNIDISVYDNDFTKIIKYFK